MSRLLRFYLVFLLLLAVAESSFPDTPVIGRYALVIGSNRGVPGERC